ncbi:type I glutamate--ammonia ligase [Phytohabitans aurantiacus]|uniref:Glutamine synthetase n=1 Tax=Phytohabitans aurantiacus TaxID=3016789 RepID=A0ABQ5R716_9ACTN|nr:glutamine synthetase family protein [Phytohabitans aurantiacus]GLI01775.1 glutamine synthetase [Phytohabitans aurantiacus]
MSARTAFVGTCDLSGRYRGRAVPYSRHQAALDRGVGWVPANAALTCFGPIAEPNAFGSVGDLRLMPDPATAVEIPEPPGVVLYLADQTTTDGDPWAVCPRATLARILERLRRETGLTVLASFEHEFTLAGTGPAGTHPASAMTFERLRAAEPFGSDLVDLLERAGLEPENWLAEYGDAQYEVTLSPAGGLVAADRAVLLRELVRDLARRRGMSASFAPLTGPDATGNGVHVHLSLRDELDRPVLYDPARPGRLSALGARFCAGVLKHAAALTAVTAASAVSFLRLRPHRWSAGGAFLGERNREALLRIGPTVEIAGADPARQFNIEYRAADATANPWLVLGALVAAGLRAITDGYPEAPVYAGAASDAELAGVPPLPASQPEALAALESDPVAAGWFDPLLLSTYLAVKRAELAALDGLKDADRCRSYADVF